MKTITLITLLLISTLSMSQVIDELSLPDDQARIHYSLKQGYKDMEQGASLTETALYISGFGIGIGLLTAIGGQPEAGGYVILTTGLIGYTFSIYGADRTSRGTARISRVYGN